MTPNDPYKAAYDRERIARKKAESLLDEKTRSLYENVLQLQTTVAALEEAQEQLIQSEKMASIGQLAAGVAHEINNPIGFSLSNLTTLSEYVDALIELDEFTHLQLSLIANDTLQSEYNTFREEKDVDFIKEDIGGLLTDSIKGLKRVSQIVANLKKVTHAGELEMEPSNINDIIEESLKVVWSELKYNMEVVKTFSTLPSVYCHRGEIHQVLMNIFINASHACEEKGVLTITTSTQKIKQTTFCVIQISDDGKGMPEAVRKKIFDPFFTTKPVGVGTGLGLSVSFGIIEKHQGKIKVASEEGKGTTFTIYLPMSE